MARPLRIYLTPLLFILILQPFFCYGEKISVSGDHSFYPFSFINEDGNPDGFDVDLIMAVAEILDMDIDITLSPWTTARKMLEEKKTDVIISMYYSESRDELADFTLPHTLIYNSIYVRDDSDIMEYADFSERTIVVSEGYLIYEYLKSIDIDFDLITASSNEEALYMMIAGQCDAAIIERIQASILIKNKDIKDIRVIDANLPPQKNCMAVSEGNEELLYKLNEGLNILKRNGTFSTLYQKWFGILENRTIFQRYRKYFILVFIAAFLILSMMLLWNRSLNRRVKSKTQSLHDEIIQRKLAEQHLEKSLKEKEIMLAEIHHRVKNNLQIMISLMELQKGCDNDKLSEHFIISTQSRINTMALIHEHLYSTQNFSKINISVYINDLAAYLISVYQIPGTHVEIKPDIPDFYINYEKTISIGLIISEILTNSIKHAFIEIKDGIISLSAVNDGENYLLKLSDNGPGFSTEKKNGRSLGLVLIDILTAQLNGSLERTDENGTSYILKIPLIELFS